MKISTKGRYALRLMLDLAINYSDTFIPLKDIASRQQISGKYLEQIIIKLHKANFLLSSRGAQGGYRLAKKPKEYTVGDILKLMENGMLVVPCLGDEEKECGRSPKCITRDVFEQIKDAVDNVVENITLADLVEKNKNQEMPVCKF